jgi:putative transposase
MFHEGVVVRSVFTVFVQIGTQAPDMLWVSDFTDVPTWAGFVYVAFVIDTFARHVLGRRASRITHAGFVLDALEPALHARRPARGGQYL